VIDHESMADEVGNFDPLEHSQVEKARRITCRFAIDSEDASVLLLMLGIHPSQEAETCTVLEPRNENTRHTPPRMASGMTIKNAPTPVRVR
jgi:hypothetical protein